MNRTEDSAGPDPKWFLGRIRDHRSERDYHAALKVCETGLENWRWNADLWQNKVNLLLRLGRLPQAVEVVEDGFGRTKAARTSLRFQIQAFNVYLEQDDFERARRRITMIADLDPALGAGYLLCVGRLGLATGEPGQALKILEPRLTEFPRNAWLHGLAVRCMVACGRADDALDLLSKVCANNPSDDFLALHAQILMDEERHDDAVSLLAEHDARLGKSPRLMLVKCRAFEYVGKFAQALTLVRRGVRDFPGDLDLNVALWRLLSLTGDSDLASDLSREFAQRPGATVRAVLAAAQFQVADGRLDVGDDILRAAMADRPGNAPLLLRAASLQLNRMFDPLAALKLLDQARDVDIGEPDLARLRASALRLTGLIPQAVEVLEELCRRIGPDAEALFQIARCKALIGLFDEARAALEGVDGNASDLRARKFGILAGISFQEGDLAGARDYISSAIALRERNGENLEELAKYQMLAGDYGAAWANNLAYIRQRHEQSGDKKISNKPVRTMIGQVLNECRLYYGDRDRFGLRWDAGVLDDARRYFRGELAQTPGNTPAAIGLLGALRRTGHITPTPPALAAGGADNRIPKIIFQYWDDPEPPEQVAEVMDNNRRMNPDYDYRRFDLAAARDYLTARQEEAAAKAFWLTTSAAGQSDILRLAVLWHEGGVYLDADDRCVAPFSGLLDHRMRFIGYQETFWTVGNNFLAVQPHDPIIRAALDDATEALAGPLGASIWLSSGPGAISRALMSHGTDQQGLWQEGVWVMPLHRMQNFFVPHIRLPYKVSDAHWSRRMQRRE